MPHKAALLLSCFAVAIISSWPWLVQPNLRPGIPAPFEARAPRDARVVDSEAHEQRRSHLVQSTFVQVLDQQETTRLKERLERNLAELERVALNSDTGRIGPVNLTTAEQIWLKTRSQQERKNWDMAIRRASERMLNQGLNNLALEQLHEAASLQLADLGERNGPARSLSSKLLANTYQGSSNLRTDPARSQRLIEELITKQDIPIIEVRRGDLITSKGEPISQRAYAVLNHFGRVSRGPDWGPWLSHFSEALAGCGVMLLIMRRERPCLEARHGDRKSVV